MQKNFFKKLAGFISIVLLLNACSKDNETPQFTIESIKGMFYYYEDESLGRIRVLDLGAEIRRGYTLDASLGITLQTICEDRSDQLLLKAYKAPVGSPSYINGARFVKPYEVQNAWMFTSNVISGLVGVDDEDWFDVHMNPDKFHAFKFHEMGTVNGEMEYAIESVHFPGQYITHTGHPIQGTNTISYAPFTNADSAPRWRLFKPTGTFLEGDLNLISSP